jgi:hypothetical protein
MYSQSRPLVWSSYYAYKDAISNKCFDEKCCEGFDNKPRKGPDCFPYWRERSEFFTYCHCSSDKAVCLSHIYCCSICDYCICDNCKSVCESCKSIICKNCMEITYTNAWDNDADAYIKMTSTCNRCIKERML